MNKSQKNKVLVKTETVADFFTRGKETAKLLDQKKIVKSRRIISFEDTRDLVKFLAETKLNLIAAVRKQPNSVTELAKTLKRSRTAIDKDIQLLEAVGIIKSEYVINPGHGKQKMISAIDKEPLELQVQTII